MNITKTSSTPLEPSSRLRANGVAGGQVSIDDLPRKEPSSFNLNNVTPKEMRSLNMSLYEDGKISREVFDHGEILYSFMRGVDRLNQEEANKRGGGYISSLDSEKFDLIDFMKKQSLFFKSDGQDRAADLSDSLLLAYGKIDKNIKLSISASA
jgi:hypothetical protein